MQESGFVHSAFTFVYESMLGRSNIRNADRSIPPGALISFLQKGLQYVGIEENLHREGTKARKSSSPAETSSLSLLSPQTINALTREHPPIQLNVPPATAAAAVRARLEAEAKIEADRKAAAVQEAAEQALASGAPKITGPSGLPPQAALTDPHQLARNAIANQAANLSHQQLQASGPLDSAGAAALVAQQRREVAAQMAAFQEEQLQQQFQLQQQLQHEQFQQLQHQHQHQQAQFDSSGTAQAAATLASVAGQLSGNKRSASGKKGPKKGKGSKQQKQAAPLEEENTGFGALGEAVARLEAANANGRADKVESHSSQDPAPMDVEENDQQGSGPAQPAHAEVKEPMNGNHTRPVNGVKDGEGNPQENHHHRKEGGPSKGPDATIDKEDELTNANPNEVLELKMHSSEVFMCAWNPVFTDMIATGSGDASARIWQMGGKTAADGLGPVRLLPHGTGPRDRKNKDVTTLEWSSDGNLLATGSYDGVARVWSRNGALVHTLRGHKGPIFSLKWNKRGNYLLSGSYDQTTIVWDVSGSAGFVEQQFDDHQAPALDVDWKDDITFASCSTDKTVHICKVGLDRPIKTYTGHTDEVNAVKWDPSGRLLASCSDDCTAKVWDVESDRKDPLQDFKSHQQEIYTVKWYVDCRRYNFGGSLTAPGLTFAFVPLGVQLAQGPRTPRNKPCLRLLPLMDRCDCGMSKMDLASRCFLGIEILSIPSRFLHPEPSWRVDPWRDSCIFGTSRKGNTSRVSRARVTYLKWHGTKKKVESLHAFPLMWCASLTSRSRLTWSKRKQDH